MSTLEERDLTPLVFHDQLESRQPTINELRSVIKCAMWQSDRGCLDCPSEPTCGKEEGKPLDCQAALDALTSRTEALEAECRSQRMVIAALVDVAGGQVVLWDADIKEAPLTYTDDRFNHRRILTTRREGEER